jgi:hypothetical protein
VNYLQALWALVLCAILSAAWLDATAAATLAAARHAALRAASVALERAQDMLVESVAAQAATGAAVFSAPSPGPPVPACPRNGKPCPLWVATSVVLAGQTGAGQGGANQTALNVQGQAAILEQRLGATVTAVVTTPSGATVAQLSRRVTLRTLATWPYVTLSGSEEPSVEGIAVGDFAGACTGGSCGDDSRVHAVLVCSDPSQPQRCAGRPDLPVDAFTSPPWYDGNAAPQGWSQ